MARTKDPHAATLKAWESRGRAQERQTHTVQSGGDYLRPARTKPDRLPDGTLADERGGDEPPKPGEPFIVYRLGRSTTTELRGNAGNAESVSWHLTNVDDMEGPAWQYGSGDTVHAFRVVVDKEFGNYEQMLSKVVGEGSTVGRTARDTKDGRVRTVSYSFPAGGPFRAERIASIPLSRVREILQGKYPEGRGDFDLSGSAKGADAIREAFRAG